MLAQVETADELDGEYYETFAFPRARGNRLYKNFVWFRQAFIEQYARARCAAAGVGEAPNKGTTSYLGSLQKTEKIVR